MYATSDLACVLDRVERLDADLLRLRRRRAAGAAPADGVRGGRAWRAGCVPPAEAVHVAFGNVLGDDRKMLRSRTGDSVKLIELLDEAVERAAAAVAEKNPDLDDDAARRRRRA